MSVTNIEKQNHETSTYACFSVDLKDATMDSIQDALRQAYTAWRANPQYLFVSEQDKGHELLMHVDKPLVMLTNQVTGQYMRIITLPDLEPGKIVFGFFNHA